jgi:inosine-uridine nucleoside N-ribohydrolase
MSILSNIYRYIKRAAIFFLIFATIGSIIYTIRVFRAGSKKSNFSAIIDSDSGNGVDDLFAIARALADPGFEVIGLTSVQWNHYPSAVEGTAGMSQELNDTLLKLFSRENIPHPRGGEEMVGYWNQPAAQRSEAAEFIITKAHEVTKGGKLNIIALGALTNLASAVLLDSTIVPKLKVYTLAMHYDPATKVWNKNEINVRNDLDALDILLNTDGLEMHIMPASSAKTLVLNTAETFELMKSKGPQWDFLLGKWSEKSSNKKDLTMLDVALIEAILNPDFVKEEQAITPPENKRKPVFIYTRINKEFMRIDYWKTIKNYTKL